MLVSKVQHGARVHTSAPSEINGSDPLASADSFGGSLLAALKYPTAAGSPLTILPSVDPDISYTYYADGLLATRTDERGIIFKYYYDHAGRLTKVLADESNATTYLYNDTPPKDRVDQIAFSYDPATGRLLNATADDRDGGSGGASTPVASSDYLYDPRGNLIAESQFHANANIPTYDPTIWYTWNYEPASQGNRERLESIQYPIPVPDGATSTLNRLLTLSYGAAGSAADALSQVTAVTDSDLGLLASFQYTGTGRRVAFDRGGTTLSPVVRSSVFDNPIAAWDQGSSPCNTDYFGLNPFGQTRALAYWRGTCTSPEVLAAHRYAHDAAGRRTAVWNQQIPIAAPNAPPLDPPVGTNERSQHFAYDALGRLIEADMGKLTGPLDDTSELAEPVQTSDLLPHARRLDWTLDSRDTWTLREELLDGDNDGDANGINEDDNNSTTAGENESFATHFVGDRNELLGYDDPAAHSNPIPALADRFHNDASGNLILDDDRFYEYDAWGRLVKVSERGTLALDIPVENEAPELEGAPGRWLVHYTYDALGRLIRKQTPVRDGTTNEQLALRTERYYYDGARRIQEIATEPIIDIDPEPQGSGGPSGGLTLAEEMELLEGESEANIFVDREYVYVPSGASGYVDEFICQIDRYQDLWYILQDVNYNVIALTDSGGDVVRQHTFDPYGEILTAEDFDTHPGIKIGHQGLFFDRLEPPAPVGGLISMSAAVQLQPGVFGLYQARNRVLLPRYGRWAQKDPNASGMLHAALWHDGQAPRPELATAALSEVLGDGANLFAVVGGSPPNAMDPEGLFSLFFMVPGLTTKTINESKQATPAFATLEYVRTQMLMQMGRLAGYGNAAVDALLADLTGTGVGIGATAGVAAYKGAEQMAARGTLQQFSQSTFRSNFQTLSGFSGRAIGTALHAHHIVPQAAAHIFSKMRINIHNPVFARWMWPDAHTALHANKTYNKEWKEFGKSLLKEYKSGRIDSDEALLRTMRFVEETCIKYGLQ